MAGTMVQARECGVEMAGTEMNPLLPHSSRNYLRDGIRNTRRRVADRKIHGALEAGSGRCPA